jgi:RND family efflux transporter MFP subunit
MRQVIYSGRHFAGVCAIIILLAGCGKPDIGGKVETKPALTVELVSPITTVWPVGFAVSGRVEAWEESVISSEADGYKLDEVLVNVGDSVNKGQLLARFNNEGALAKLEEMEAEVRAGEAVLATSTDQLSRSARLVNSRAISEESHKQNESAVERNQAELSSARARLSARQLEFSHTNVVAPDDGVISSRAATVGTVLASGSELFKLIRQNRLEWRAEISVKHISSVDSGNKALLEVQNGGTIRGTVRQLAPMIDNRTLNATCYIDLIEPGPLKAGMFLSGMILTGESPAVHLPESSIVYRDGYTYVIRVGPDSIAHQIKVTPRRRRENFVEIGGEVSETDRLVLSGGSFVNEGDLVKVVGAEQNDSQGGAR